MKEKEYIQIKIEYKPFNEDIITGMLSLLDVKGILNEENYLIAYFDEFDKEKEKKMNNFFNSMMRELLIESCKIEKSVVINKNWNEEWEKSINPIKVSDRFVIKPSFKKYKKIGDEIVLTIDPKMSFGTGYHQTTRIMIRLIEEFIKPDTSVLDVGTGTGVLGIVAAKLGARDIFTIDNDEVCEENVIENVEKNNETEKIKYRTCEIKDIEIKKYDFILANIQRNILLDIAEEIEKRIMPNGIVILSGLLFDDREMILEKYTSLGFEFVKSIDEDEWIGIVFEKRL